MNLDSKLEILNEEMGGRLALAEVSIDELNDKVKSQKDELDDKAAEIWQLRFSEVGETTKAKIEEIMAARDGEDMKLMQDRINRLEEITQKQMEEIDDLKQGTTHPEPRNNPRMATPENENKQTHHRRSNENQGYKRNNDEDEHHHQNKDEGYKRNNDEDEYHEHHHRNEDEGYKRNKDENEHHHRNEDRGDKRNNDEDNNNRKYTNEESRTNGYDDDRDSRRQEEDERYSTPQRGNRWNIDPTSIKLRWERNERPNDNERNRNERSRSNDSESNKHDGYSRNRNERSRSNDSDERNRHDERRQSNQYEMTREERTSMDTAIRGFEKKYTNITELSETPTQESIEQMYRQLAYAANNSSIPMRSLEEMLSAAAQHTQNQPSKTCTHKYWKDSQRFSITNLEWSSPTRYRYTMI